jgi:hypothetical protein
MMTNCNPLETAVLDSSGRDLSVLEDSDRGGARTHDQRINVPHRLSPTAGIAPGGDPGVEGLDYPIAIAGVPRLVSGAGTGDPPDPCLLITQSRAFLHRHACRRRRRCGGAGSQGVPAYCGMHSSRFGFFPREAPIYSRLRVR